jgi:hypothetical protein
MQEYSLSKLEILFYAGCPIIEATGQILPKYGNRTKTIYRMTSDQFGKLTDKLFPNKEGALVIKAGEIPKII